MFLLGEKKTGYFSNVLKLKEGEGKQGLTSKVPFLGKPNVSIFS